MTRKQAIQQLGSLRAHCDSMFDDKWSEYEVWSRDILAINIAIATIAAIEDILGDEYDFDRLRELAQADREGRCVVLPSVEYTEEDGENALKSAMHTCFYRNTPVTRYIADAVAEKLTREAAEKALEEMEENDHENGSI